jgi:hypothetical protein
MVIAETVQYEGQLEAQAQRLGIRERVTFAGWVKHDDIPALMNEATWS